MTHFRRPAIAFVIGLLFATSASAAPLCLSDKADQESVIGTLSIGRAKDAAGRPERPYIVTLAAPVCLSTADPDDKVDASTTVHIFATDPKVSARIAELVGKSVAVRGRPFPALTAHHHAPIVMEVYEIAAR